MLSGNWLVTRLSELSRRDIVTIARRFNAGLGAKTPQVPKGRLRFNPTNIDRRIQYGFS